MAIEFTFSYLKGACGCTGSVSQKKTHSARGMKVKRPETVNVRSDWHKKKKKVDMADSFKMA